MLYAVTIEFDTQTSDSSFTDIVPFRRVLAAVAVFKPLMVAYPFGEQVTVRSKQTGHPEKTELIGASLYQADVSRLDEMVKAVRDGSALIDWTGALDDLENTSN